MLMFRYNKCYIVLQDIVKNLANYYNNHLHYKDAHTEFVNWLAETKLRLQTIHRTAGSKEDIGSKLQNMTVSIAFSALFINGFIKHNRDRHISFNYICINIDTLPPLQ